MKSEVSYGMGPWFYGGIRSVGRYVAVLDLEKRIRVLYRVHPSGPRTRKRLRKYLREEYGDAFVIMHY